MCNFGGWCFLDLLFAGGLLLFFLSDCNFVIKINHQFLAKKKKNYNTYMYL